MSACLEVNLEGVGYGDLMTLPAPRPIDGRLDDWHFERILEGVGQIAFRVLGESFRSAVVVADRFVASGHVTTGFLEPAKHFRVVCSDCGRWPCSCYHFPGEGAI